ncbi:MAG TPA: hypothetical protein VJY62_14235, partial [Bacteroidia bacterium]|nr:hypothetical protein [Bacteroidia bacterium]
MADGDEVNKFISKANKVFPEYLDWEKLRDEGRDYLGKFSGKLWTDHNTHDPGITILEMLCYAIMDLGYRTNLPDADIFARKPDDDTSAKDNNFFTPSQILACNPVTIMDFRKMLIDIAGVKNAWLENSFYDCNDSKNTNPGRKETACSDCYNGLYHVYIELENNYNLRIDKEKEEYEKLIDKIKSRLLSHRNLCEDFIDLHILCKKEIGVCADIELNTGVNPEDVYVKAVEKLR